MKESRNLEFKSQVSNSFLKTVSAFANFGSGTILFGIDDNGNVLGLDDPVKTCLDIENLINDTIVPKPNFKLSITHKNKVVTLEVLEGDNKPYLYKGKAYRRSDTASIEVDTFELKRLVLEGSNLLFEEIESSKQDLEFSYLNQKMLEKLEVPGSDETVLRTLGFFTKNRVFNNAAALFADNNQFPGIDIARFGESINIIKDRETHSNMCIRKQYDKTVELFKKYYQYDVIESFERKTVDIIPEVAFREAVANALVHRTWDVNSHIKIAMFDDKVEITSPGSLPNGLTQDEYLQGNISSLRNPTVANVFYRLKLIEIFGTGIRRVINSYKDSLVKPEFTVFENSIKIVLPTLTQKTLATKNEQVILDLMCHQQLLSSSQISKMSKFTKDKTIRNLNSLVDKGYIKKTGTGRGTKYFCN